MGKVRAKTLGDQEQEQKERDEAEKRRLAKIEAAKKAGKAKKGKALSVKGKEESVILGSETTPESKDAGQASMTEKTEAVHTESPKEPEQPQKPSSETKAMDDKKAKKVFAKKDTRSANWKKAATLIEKGKVYSLSQALELLEKTHLAKFDETVELHINTISALNGSMQLPHGTGKSTRVAILAPASNAAAADALLKEIETGKINFDVLVATPDAMPRLAKVARILGPKGLMPNPKNGTVTPKPEEVAKKYAGGHMTYKTEAKAPVLHLSVGKLSFGKDKLEENIKMVFKTVDGKNMKKVTLKSTMSPAIRLTV